MPEKGVPFVLYLCMANTEKSRPVSDDFYLGKKVSELNIYEQRFGKLIQLIRLDKMLKSAEITHKKIPNNHP